MLIGMGYLMVDNIVIYSASLTTAWNLYPYQDKILIAHEHFLDFNTLTVTIPFPERPPTIGFIGTLSEVKGIQNFVQALPTIFRNLPNVLVLIGGDGQLREVIQLSLQKERLMDRVEVAGWISHEDLPKYLNKLRLLVLPSYSEGLPNIMLEAMACGTPVLATPVGAIPDIIKDGETGFIMENNSPACIAENVRRALECQNLEKIAHNGKQFVEENYSFENSVNEWQRIFSPSKN
jgi:glycosyltransferase involved in cell wall biosynthesis